MCVYHIFMYKTNTDKGEPSCSIYTIHKTSGTTLVKRKSDV